MTLHSILSRERENRKGSMSIKVVITLRLFAMLSVILLIGTAFSVQPAELLPSRFSPSVSLAGRFLSKAGLAKGRFLVASPHLRDPNFLETVILLIGYDSRGAMGLVINRPTKIKLSTVLPEIKGLQHKVDTVYMGGPVAMNQMRLLIRASSQPEESRYVFEDIYVSSSQTVLQEAVKAVNSGEQFRVYAGYAGWASGQLDREVLRGDWRVLRANVESLFDKMPSKVWPKLIRQSSVRWVKIQGPRGD